MCENKASELFVTYMIASVRPLFSRCQIDALPSLNLGDQIHRDQVIEFRIFRHVVQANNLVHIAHAETFMSSQNCEECSRNWYSPNNHATAAK